MVKASGEARHVMGRVEPAAIRLELGRFPVLTSRLDSGGSLQVIARDKEDLDARWDRAVLYAQINEPRKALDAFEAIALARPGDSEVHALLPSRLHRL